MKKWSKRGEGWRDRGGRQKQKERNLLTSLFVVQIPVDIMTGVTDEQCREMAQNLEFKGSALTEVHLLALKKTFRYCLILLTMSLCL